MQETMLKILCLEDNLADAELIRNKLNKDGFTMLFELVSTKMEYLEKINTIAFDLILSDYNLPGYSGLAALDIARQICPDIPFICVSGTIGEYLAVEMLKQGASDYVLKDQLEKLPFAVRRALKEVQEQKARQKAENELRKLSQAVQQSPVSIIITNRNGDIEYVNPKTTELTGYAPDELIGKNPRIFSSGEKTEGETENLWKTISSGNEWRGEFHNKKKNGELYWEAASISPIIGADGDIANFLAIKENITERKEFIIELVKAKAKAESGDRLKTAFMNNISHEIRTPLNHILGFGKMLVTPDLTQSEKEECFSVLNDGCERLLNTVTDYMDISLIASGNMTVNKRLFNLTDLLNDIFDKFYQQSQVLNLTFTLQNKSMPHILQINSDQGLLRKVLRHLVDNAVKFTKIGSVSFGCEEKGDKLEFFVKDSGIGICKEVQATIFDKFFQENPSDTRGHEGSGLGLSIAGGIVALLGGRIWLESVKGEGSAFFFTIPSEISRIEKPANPEISVKINGNPLILMAEDEVLNSLCIKLILQKERVDLQVVTDGLQAVEACRQNSGVTLILMDLKMPRMDGFEAAKIIKTFRPNLPIVAITSYAMSGDERKAYEAGCDDYITKPFEKAALLGKLKKFGILT